MSRLPRLVRFLMIGFALNAFIAALLSIVNTSRASTESYLEGPSIDHLGAHFSSGITAAKLTGFGCQRRGWYFNPGFGESTVSGLPFGWFSTPTTRLFQFPFEDGPQYAWSVGGASSWGRLFSTELESMEQAKQFHGFEVAFGFPALSFWHELAVAPDDTATTPGGIRLPDPVGMVNPRYQVRAIPFRPTWPGVLVNTLFYAIVTFLLVQIRGVGIRSRRMVRGQCPECKYDLGFNFSTGCPECGWRRPRGKRTGTGPLDPAPLD